MRLAPIDGPLVELASGIDALYLSGQTDLPGSLVGRLEAGRARAAEVGEPIPFEFGGGDWHIAGHGWLMNRFCLTNELGRLGVSPSQKLPSFYLQPAAAVLHGVGPQGTVDWIEDATSLECESVQWTVSRLDLFSDWQHWALDGDDRHRFVCRAGDRATYENNEVLTGFTLGRRTTGTVAARIYDKPKDIAVKGSDFWLERWGDAYDGVSPVMRVEFEFGRAGLRQFDLTRPAGVLAAVGDLWDYATGDWLSFRSPTGDQTRSRWPVSEEWQQIQSASFLEERLGIERVAAGKAKGSLRLLLPALNGYLASVAAVLGVSTIDDALRVIRPHLIDYEISSRVSFGERVHRKWMEARA